MTELLTSKEVKKIYGKQLRAILAELAEGGSDILAAQVCTSDGFEVASVHRDEESHRRVAAMVSSLHALGSALVEETELGNYVNLIIEATKGKCLMMSIPGSADSLLLVAVASPSLLFGVFHQACIRACKDLGDCLAD